MFGSRSRRRPAASVAAAAFVWAAACGDNAGSGDIPAARGRFPDGFRWGTAISAYQTEGGLHATDWYQWEQRCDSCSGQSADDGPAFLDHHDDDFAAAEAMSNNAVRLGIEWSRVFPTEASFPASPDPDAVALYHDIFASARAHGLDVMLTLHHFSLPVWVHDLDAPDERAGWEDPAIVDRFATWAGWAAAEYGGEVDLWITLNEPFVVVVGGWIAGEVPPGKTLDVDTGLEVGFRMIEAHARAYDAIAAADTDDADGDGDPARISIAQHSRVFLPRDPSMPEQVDAARMLRYLLNDTFLDAAVLGNYDANHDFDLDDPEDIVGDPALAGRMDYIGLNYYGVTLVVETPNDANFPLIGLPLFNDLDRQGLDGAITDYGWTIYPQGLRTVLDELVRFDLPILITENGLADGADALRPRFLLEHLYEVNRAIDDGLPIEGYYYWSLMDNFEWTAGYCPRFGLLSVDFDDPARPRTAGPGADVYRRIIDAGTVPVELFATYPDYPLAGFCPRVGL